MYASPELRPNPALNGAKNRQAVLAGVVALLTLLGFGGLWWRHYHDARPDPALELTGELWPAAHDRTWELLHRSRYWTAYFDHHTSSAPTVEVEVTFVRQSRVRGAVGDGFLNTFCTVYSLPERRKLFVGSHQQPVSSHPYEQVDGLSPQEAAVEEAKFESLTHLKHWLDCGALRALANVDRERFTPLIREASQTPGGGPLANEAKAILAGR